MMSMYDSEADQIAENPRHMVRHLNQLLEKAGAAIRVRVEVIEPGDGGPAAEAASLVRLAESSSLLGSMPTSPIASPNESHTNESHTKAKIQGIERHGTHWRVTLHGHENEAQYIVNLLVEAGLPILRQPEQIQNLPMYAVEVNDHRAEVEERIKKALCENQYVAMPEDREPGADG